MNFSSNVSIQFLVPHTSVSPSVPHTSVSSSVPHIEDGAFVHRCLPRAASSLSLSSRFCLSVPGYLWRILCTWNVQLSMLLYIYNQRTVLMLNLQFIDNLLKKTCDAYSAFLPSGVLEMCLCLQKVWEVKESEGNTAPETPPQSSGAKTKCLRPRLKRHLLKWRSRIWAEFVHSYRNSFLRHEVQITSRQLDVDIIWRWWCLGKEAGGISDSSSGLLFSL